MITITSQEEGSVFVVWLQSFIRICLFVLISGVPEMSIRRYNTYYTSMELKKDAGTMFKAYSIYISFIRERKRFKRGREQKGKHFHTVLVSKRQRQMFGHQF